MEYGNCKIRKGDLIMKDIRKRQAGFTLMEILIAVGILAILAAVAVPVVAHLGQDNETNAAAVELSNLQAAVDALMVDQGLASLSNPVSEGKATSNMSQFPDWENDAKGGYVLYPGKTYKNSDADKFIRQANTQGAYYCDTDGTVHQKTSGY